MTDEPGLAFDRIAEEYDRVRPGYPPSLVERACSRAAIEPGASVVEVGCGTGKLTTALVERGLRIEAVDPGPELIAVARRRVGDAPVRFRLARFEDVNLRQHAFAAVFSATAFHWIDPTIGWSKVARALRPGGLLALLTHVAGADLELRMRFRSAWEEVLPEASSWELHDVATIWAGAENRRHNVSEVWAWLEHRELARPEAAELFTDVEIEKVLVHEELTAESLVASIRTTSAYTGLDAGRQERLDELLVALVDDLGGIYRRAAFATLVTARSAAPAPALSRSRRTESKDQ